MKKVLVLTLFLLLLTGCNKVSNKTLYCNNDEVIFDEGKMTVSVEFELDKKDRVLSSTQIEKRVYNKKKDATEFYNNHTNTVTKDSDKELTYKARTEYSDLVSSEKIKKALEGQGYTCEYKNKSEK